MSKQFPIFTFPGTPKQLSQEMRGLIFREINYRAQYVIKSKLKRLRTSRNANIIVDHSYEQAIESYAYVKNYVRNPHLSYFRQDSAIIQSAWDTLLVYCPRHKNHFISNLHNLRDRKAHVRVCLYCLSEIGLGRGITTLGDLKDALASGKTGFFINKGYPSRNASRQVLLRSGVDVELLCSARKADGKPCSYVSRHRFNNVKTLITHTKKNNSKRHLYCQGSCDSTKKGKHSRLPISELNTRLKQCRNGDWSLADKKKYIKAGEKSWFVHKRCGFKVHRIPGSILNYAVDNGLPKSTINDCPYCSKTSPVQVIDGDIDLFARWLLVATDGHLEFDGQAAPTDNETLFEATCSRSGNTVTTSIKKLKKKNHGCRSCEKSGRSRQRAWKRGDAVSVLERRKLSLIGNPGSYIVPCKVKDVHGNIKNNRSILDICKEEPATVNGYHSLIKQSQEYNSSRSDKGVQYSKEEDRFIFENAGKLRHSEIARILKRTLGSVNQRAIRLGVTGHVTRKYELKNQAAFDSPTVEAVYFAALLLTDGTLSIRKARKKGQLRYMVKLELHIVDEPVLVSLAKFVGYMGPLNYRTVKTTAGRSAYASLTLDSKQLCHALMSNYGLRQRKTFTVKVPDLRSRKHLLAFLAGIIEGDGHITKHRAISIVTSSPKFLYGLRRIVKRLTNVDANIQIPKGEKTYKYLFIDSFTARILYDLFVVCRVPMTMLRKWEKFL